MEAIRVGLGRAQYHAMMSAGRRFLRLRKTNVRYQGIDVPVFTREGRGAPLVFIHGFGGDKEGWLPMIARLEGRAIIALDLPGFGEASRIEPSRATAKEQARAVKAVLDSLGKRSAVVVGASMGGGISLRLASDFPDVVRAVVLLGSVGPIVDKSPLVHALDAGHNPLIPRSHEEYAKMIDFVAEKKMWMPPTIRSYLASKYVAHKDTLTELFAAWVAQDAHAIEGALANVKAPTLVIHGECDRVIDVSTARAIASRVPNAKLMLLAGVGHVPQYEATKRVAVAIEAHIADVA